MQQEERWRREQTFFDNEEYSEEPTPANTIERYLSCRKPFLAAEFPFAAMGDARDKRVLEIGCGDGGNAVLLALKGAHVVGIDISPRAIQIAQNRAEMHNVADRAHFFALPLECYVGQAEGRFDIIYGFAILHHLLPVLDGVIDKLKELSHEETMFIFSEPVSLSPWLRKLRLALPIAVHGTEDERPLEPADLATICKRLPDIRIERFGLLLHIWTRFIGGRYEDYSWLTMALYDALARIDHALLSLPGIRRFACSAILHTNPARRGMRPKADQSGASAGGLGATQGEDSEFG